MTSLTAGPNRAPQNLHPMTDQVIKFLTEVGVCLLQRDADGLFERFSPWISPQERSHLLERLKACEAKVGEPDGLSLQGNPASLEQLQREGLELPAEVSQENFLSWSCVSLEIGEETTVYELWCAVVKTSEGDCSVGYFEILEAE